MNGDTWEDVLQRLVDAGEVTRPRVPKRDWVWRARGVGLPAGTAEQVLEEIRAERYPPDA